MSRPYDTIVVGAGIVGLAFALSCARRGQRVLVLEREERAVGASIRNFGLVWPIGQPAGVRFQRAKRARQTWDELGAAGVTEVRATGSLHLARSTLELQVLTEFAGLGGDGVELVTPEEAAKLCPAVKRNGLAGGLYSPHERMVDPRHACEAISAWLQSTFGVEFRFGAAVRNVATGCVELTDGQRLGSNQTYVCSGPDLRSLFPNELATAGVTLCKLQMMRTEPQPSGWRLGPSLCAGLTLGHYEGFAGCPSLPQLLAEFHQRYPRHMKSGIHVLVSQNGDGGLCLGDTHEYGGTHDPFQLAASDELVLGYLAEFAELPQPRIAERWIGVYPRLKGCSELVLHPLPGVTLVNALGGAGMTLSFGLAEDVMSAHE